jgi:hypothetical protein
MAISNEVCSAFMPSTGASEKNYPKETRWLHGDLKKPERF